MAIMKYDSQEQLANWVGIVALSVTTLLSLPTIQRRLVPRTIRLPSNEAVGDGGLYEDQDGIATAESVQAYSDLRSRIAVYVTACLGLGASVACRVLERTASNISIVHAISKWSDLACWVSTKRHG
jgi:hypothetical protein